MEGEEPIYAKPHKVRHTATSPGTKNEYLKSLKEKKRNSKHFSAFGTQKNITDKKIVSTELESPPPPPSYPIRRDTPWPMKVLPSIDSTNNFSMMNNSDNGRTLRPRDSGLHLLSIKDTNDMAKFLLKMRCNDEATRFIDALKERYRLEEQFIGVCKSDGIDIVEADYDDHIRPHTSIGGLKVYGVPKKFIIFDEYDPDILQKYSKIDEEETKREMAARAANLRREAANMTWTANSLEGMIDVNSRVKYLRKE